MMMEKKELFTGLSHIGIPTGNIDETIRFFEKFGFEIWWRKEDPASPVAFLRRGTCVIETYASDVCALANGAVDHIAVDVTDIEAAYQYALSEGYQALEGQITFLPFFENGVRFFTILGPNHEKLEFSQKL